MNLLYIIYYIYMDLQGTYMDKSANFCGFEG